MFELAIGRTISYRSECSVYCVFKIGMESCKIRNGICFATFVLANTFFLRYSNEYKEDLL